MNNFNKYFLIFFCSTFLLSPVFSYAQERIFYMSQGKEKEGIADVKKNAGKIDILAPQFYGISEKLKLVGGLDAQLQKVISQYKIKVMPLVSNAGFRQDVMHNLLISPTAQDAAVKAFVDTAKKNGYIGWQFDFENISYLDKDLYSSFVEKTAQALHQSGFILSVAAVSRSVDYEDTDAFKNWGGAFDYARIAKASDFVSLMTYDDPNSVGPVASLPFISKVLAYVKDKIPAEKLSLGIPLYYWGWSTSPFKKVVASGTYDGLLRIRANIRHTLGFDDILGAAWISYFYNNQQYQIWYQSKDSFQNKLNIIKQNNFRGFSAWVLGVEDPGIWATLDTSINH